MRVDQELHGVVIIDVGGAIGSAGCLQAEQAKECQESGFPEISPTPVFEQREQTSASAQRSNQGKQEFAGCLELQDLFPLEGWFLAQQAAE